MSEENKPIDLAAARKKKERKNKQEEHRRESNEKIKKKDEILKTIFSMIEDLDNIVETLLKSKRARKNTKLIDPNEGE